jgi:phosphatidylserine/phosphatidylglycerophosphate/cardiolipin synthase-like enzyme
MTLLLFLFAPIDHIVCVKITHVPTGKNHFTPYSDHTHKNVKDILNQSVFFDKDIKPALLHLIKHEKGSIEGALYNFTDHDIFQSMIKQQKRHHIDISLAINHLKTPHDRLLLNTHGIHTFKVRNRYSNVSYENMHHKFLLFERNKNDKPVLWISSYNLTNKNEDRNSALIITDPHAIYLYKKEYDKLKSYDQSQPHTRPTYKHQEFLTKINTIKRQQMNQPGYKLPPCVFAPHIKRTLRYLIKKEQSHIDIASFVVNDNKIIQDIADKNITADIVIDKMYTKLFTQALHKSIQYSSLISPMAYHGEGRMHHKFMLFHNINGKPLLCVGSYNLTGAAHASNWESMCLIDDDHVISQFMQEFQSIKNESKPIDVSQLKSSRPQNSYTAFINGYSKSNKSFNQDDSFNINNVSNISYTENNPTHSGNILNETEINTLNN